MKPFFIVLLLVAVLSFSVILLCSDIDMQFCSYLAEHFTTLGAAAIHLGLFSAAMIYLWKKDLKTTLKSLAFPGDIKKNLMLSAAGFAMVLITLLILGIIAEYFGFADQEAVYEKVLELPVYVLLFAVIAAPVSEELFFRALLVPRIGVLASSVLFGLMHFSYGSVIEIAGAALVGIILGVIYKTGKSITPVLIIHIMYNLLSILVIRLLI